MADHHRNDKTLRQRALEILSGEPADARHLTPEEIDRLLAEFRVYRAELEIQNEELRVAQSNLEETRRYLADLYDFAPVGYFTLEPDGTVRDANFTAADLLGVERRFIGGSAFRSWVARSHQDAVEQHFTRLYSTELPQRDEVQLVRANGEKFWALLESVVPELGQEPKVCRTVVLDISERKAAEQERLKAAIVEHSKDVIIGLALDKSIISWNPAAADLFGYTEAQMVGRSILTLFPTSDASLFDPSNVQSGGARAELATKTRRGERIHVDITASPVLNGGGQLVGLSLVLRDITARKQVEEALRKSEERYRTLFDSIDEGFCIIEVLFDAGGVPVDYVFLETNPAFTEHTGLVDAVGKRIREMVPGHEEHWFETYGRVALTQQPERFTNKAGALGQRWYDVYAFPVSAAEEHKLGVIFNDISERMRIESDEREQRVFAEALAKIAQAVNSTLKLDEVLDLILEHVERVVAHDVAEIILFEGDLGRVVRSRGYGERGLADKLASMEFSITKTPNLAYLADNAVPIVIPDLEQHEGWFQVFEEERLRSYVGAPIRVRGKTIGCLNLISTEPGFFNEAHGQRLQAFADQAANALHNARLFGDAQEAATLQERHRLARDLHDAVSQTLFSSSIMAEALERQWHTDPEKAAKRLGQVVVLNRAAMSELRSLLYTLRPEALEKTELKELLSQLLDVARGRIHVDTSIQVTGQPMPLPPNVHVAFYRIAQEGINNVIKHSKATILRVELRQEDGTLTLSVSDNGKGYDVKRITGGLGRESMRERAQAIGAELEIVSAPGDGTRIRLLWSEGEHAGSPNIS